MSKQAPGPMTKGIINIKVRDAETMEIKREINETNTFTLLAVEHAILGRFNNGNSNINPALNQAYNRLYTSERKVAEVPANIYPGLTGRDKQDIVVQAPTYFSGSPPYMEIVGRFNPPVVARSVETIYWGFEDTDSPAAVAYATLPTPCPHGTTEVLDITYRIQFFFQPADSFSTGTGLFFGSDLRRQWTSNYSPGFPEEGQRIWTSKFPQNSAYNYLTQTESYLGTSRVDDMGHRKWTFTFSKGEADFVGSLLGGVGFGRNGGNPFSSNNDLRLTSWGPLAGDTFTNKPIQPVHNHSFDAIEPFLDVDFLAASSGTLNVDGSGWTDPDWPKFYRIEYTSTGLVGASNYFYRVRDTMGFGGSSYVSATNDNQFKMRLSGQSELTGTGKTIPNGHGLRSLDLEEYDNMTKISWNTEGITILNDVTGEYVNFDSTTTPAIGFVSVSQVAVDDNKNIWVSDRSGGLYKITDPLGSPSVTHFDNATHGIPVTGESACYAVAIGSGNSIWAMFNGALSKSTDGGTSWFNHDPVSSPAFDFTGITDSNWSNVFGLRVDRESINFQMAILGTEGSGAPDLLWWDPATATAITGPSYVSSNRLRYCRCSRFGGLWSIRELVSSNFRYRTKYGTTEKLSLMQPGRPFDGWDGGICFIYDSYGTPHFFGGGDEHLSIGGVFTMEGKRIDDIPFVGWYQDYATPFFTFEENKSGGPVYTKLNDTSGAGINADIERPESMTILDPTSEDALNQEYSPFEEFVWREYRWDGAAWVRDWHAPAVDTSGNGNDANRMNFDIENHTFTGRSLIDASAIFNPSAFTTDATFAFKLSPTTKPTSSVTYTKSKQEPEIIVMEVNDFANANRLKFWWDDTTGDMLLQDKGATVNLGPKPADGGTYRAVVIVNSTTASLYIDNVLIGALTLTAPLSMANVSGDLLWYVGSRNYNPEYNSVEPRVMPYMFWHGDMENVQAWSRAWTVPEVAEDFGIGVGTGVIANTASFEARYELTQALAETKATHLSSDSLEDGLNIAFVEGTVGNSFIATDYHTFGVFDGILKDNAISMSYKFSVYARPIDLDFTEFLNDGLTDTVPVAISGTLIEPVYWADDTSSNNSTVTRNPGQIVASGTSTSGGSCGVQAAPGDVTWTFKAVSNDENGTGCGITATPSTINSAANMTHELRFQSDGSVDIYEANVLVHNNAALYTFDDDFQIKRTGGTITYYKVIAGTPTLISTSGTASAGTRYFRMHHASAGYGIHDATIEYAGRPALIMDIGNSGTPTGKFDPDFVRFETETPESISINIDGTPADVIVSDTWEGNMTVPVAGQVIVNGRAGLLVFNVADVGKTITGQVTALYEQF